MMSASSPLQMAPRAPIALVFVGILMGLVYVSYSFLPILDPPYALRYIFVSLVLFALYLVAVWLSRSLEGGGWLWLLLAMGVCFHLCLLLHAPSMSDDIFRYLWDGRVLAHGLNPFAYPPSSTQLAPLTELLHHPYVNHPDYRTVYPPLAQLLFWLGYQLSPGHFGGYKLLLLVFQCGLIGCMAIWLRRRGRPMGRLLWVAWCPLPVFEVMLDGHIDGFAPLLLVGVLLAAQVRRPWLCGVALGLVLLIKPLPLFVVPLLLWHLRWRRALQMCVACALTCLLLYLPLLDAGAMLFQSLMAYSRHWHFNGPLYELLSIWLVPGAVRGILAAGIISISLATPFLRLPLTFEQRFLLPLVAYLLMTPTLYPWYLVWLVPWLVMAPGPWLFWLVGVVLGAHFVHHSHVMTGRWQLHPAIVWVEFLPLVLWLGTQCGLWLYRSRQEGWRGWRWRWTWKSRRGMQAEIAALSSQLSEMEQRLAALEAPSRAPKITSEL